MKRGEIADAGASSWDDEASWGEADVAVSSVVSGHRHSWIVRQLIAAIWITIAWAVGTLVFELGAVG